MRENFSWMLCLLLFLGGGETWADPDPDAVTSVRSKLIRINGLNRATVAVGDTLEIAADLNNHSIAAGHVRVLFYGASVTASRVVIRGTHNHTIYVNVPANAKTGKISLRPLDAYRPPEHG